MLRRRSLIALLSIAVSGSLQAQISSFSNTGPIAFPINASGQVNGIGRVSQLKWHASIANKLYAVSASGGLYISTNNGISWTVTSGSETLPQTSCSAVCIDFTNDQVMYLSLGDADYYSNDFGIYKTTNGGVTWAASNTGIGTSMAVEILMQPGNNQSLVAATKNGIYTSANAGASWTQKLNGSFTDMKAKPGSSTTLYATNETVAYYSTNYGQTWTQATGITGTTGSDGMRLAVSANAPNTVYAVAALDNGIVWKSTNSGVSYTNVYTSASQCLICYDETPGSYSQGNYNIDLSANPTNANELILVAHNVWQSTDGGVNWIKRTDWYDQMHTDMHQIDWNPYNNNEKWCVNDGGVWMSTDPQAVNWITRSDGVAATECYHGAQSPVKRELVNIGTQDNGEAYYRDGSWRTIRGGDWGARTKFDYSPEQNAYYLENGERRSHLPVGGDEDYNSPFIATNNSRIDFVKNMQNVGFLAKDSIWRTNNLAATVPTWTRILTNSNEVRDLIVSTADSNILFMVNKNSQFFRSKNALSATPTFTQITTPATTNNAASIATVRSNKAIVYLTCANKVYRSADTGNTWTNVTGTGLSTMNIRSIIHDDYSTNERIFVNAGSLVHSKTNANNTWTNISNNGLPSVCNTRDMIIYNDGTAASILRIATYGRGVWQSDINANLAPATDFTAMPQQVCPGQTVQFTSSVFGTGNVTLSWSFPGGTPATSTTANPVVTYNTPGIYNVTLAATNSNGTTTISKPNYITVTVGQSGPIVEGFEGSVFPPANWLRESPDNTNWIKYTGIGGFGNSNNSIRYDNYGIFQSGERISIMAPKVDLTTATGATLKFDVAYAVYSGAQPDSLQVRVSTDCGATWNAVYTKTGADLATAPNFTSSIFEPAASEWRTETVSLNAFAGSGILVSFDNIGHYGQALYLDNVNITSTGGSLFSANDTTVCAGTNVIFTATNPAATSYSWSFPGGTPATASTPTATVTYAAAGQYNVTLSTTGGSSASQTKTNYITVTTPTVSITQAGVVLTANGSAGSYQWLLNGTAISGATGNMHTALQNGSYTVTVTDAQGCAATSAAVAVSNVGIGSVSIGKTSISVYPNPSTGLITLKAENLATSLVTMQLYNATGQLVRSENMVSEMAPSLISLIIAIWPKAFTNCALAREAKRPACRLCSGNIFLVHFNSESLQFAGFLCKYSFPKKRNIAHLSRSISSPAHQPKGNVWRWRSRGNGA